MRLLAIVLTLATLASCQLPAKWAEEFVQTLECDMLLEQVRSLTPKEIQEEDAPRRGMTHFIRDGRTDVWLVFKDNQLKSAQVLWAQEMMKYASYQQIQLCN